jgi:hypothetical protein
MMRRVMQMGDWSDAVRNEISTLVSRIEHGENFPEKAIVLDAFRVADYVMRTAYPGPVKPPPGSSGGQYCPHCGKKLP